ERLVRSGDGHLRRYHPRVEGSSNGAQVTKRLARAHPSYGDSDQPEHFPLEQLPIREIQRILEDYTDAAVHLGRTENDPIGGTEIAEKALHGLDGGALLLATQKRKVVGGQVQELRVRTTLFGPQQGATDSHARRARGAKAPSQADDPNHRRFCRQTAAPGG